MTADVELLPCPFCGGVSTLTDEDSPICPVGHILCDDCYASADATRWNTRACVEANTEALRAEVAKQSAYAKRTHDWNTELLANNERLAEALRKIAAIAHSGGLIDMSEADALTAIRRLTKSYWGREEKPEQVHTALNPTAAQEGKSDG